MQFHNLTKLSLLRFGDLLLGISYLRQKYLFVLLKRRRRYIPREFYELYAEHIYWLFHFQRMLRNLIVKNMSHSSICTHIGTIGNKVFKFHIFILPAHDYILL